MALLLNKIPRVFGSFSQSRNLMINSSMRTTFSPTDAVLDKPHQSKMTSYACVAAAVITGISAGAWMSKNIASFLEENELFVPSDDDDDY